MTNQENRCWSKFCKGVLEVNLTRAFSALPLALAAMVAVFAHTSIDQSSTDIKVATGWFSDERCAPSRIKSRTIGPNNRECTQRCIQEGAKMVFIDEKAKAVFIVENPEAARDQQSHYVQITGTTNGSKMLHVNSVTVLQEYRPHCSRPKLKN